MSANIERVAQGQKSARPERRRGLRHLLAVSASVLVPGVPAQPCRIRDLCRDGMFLELGERALRALDGRLEHGDRLGVVFDSRLDGRLRRVQVDARVLRAIPGGLGVRFTSLDERALRAMQALVLSVAEARAAAQAPDAPEPDAPDAAAVLSALGAGFALAGARLVATFRQRLIEALFRAARDAEGGRAQREREAVLRELEQNSEALGEQLERAMRREFEVFAQIDDGTAPLRDAANTLGLLATQELEAVLNTGQAVHRLEVALRGRTHELEQRLSALLGQTVEAEDHPFSPDAICRVLCDGVTLSCPQSFVRASVCSALDGPLLQELERLYDELNAVLKGEGVLPDLKATVNLGSLRGG